jgi:hypothetical protein
MTKAAYDTRLSLAIGVKSWGDCILRIQLEITYKPVAQSLIPVLGCGKHNSECSLCVGCARGRECLSRRFAMLFFHVRSIVQLFRLVRPPTKRLLRHQRVSINLKVVVYTDD